MVFAALLTATLVSAAPAPKPMLPGQAVEIKTVDGWTLHAMHANAVEDKMTVLLLHGTGQSKEDWRRLAWPLTRSGYGVMAVDLRGHGASRVNPAGEEISWKKLSATKSNNDYADMSRDAAAAVEWLVAQGVREESIGLIGAEVGGSIAVRYAATHPKVPLVVILSPGMAWQEVLTVNALRALKRATPTPVLMVYSEADKRSSKEAPILYSFAKASVGERHATLLTVPQERGTRMFKAQRALIGQVIDWLGNPIKPDGMDVSSGTFGTVIRRENGKDSPDKALIDDTGTPMPPVNSDEDAED